MSAGIPEEVPRTGTAQLLMRMQVGLDGGGGWGRAGSTGEGVGGRGQAGVGRQHFGGVGGGGCREGLAGGGRQGVGAGSTGRE